MDADTTANPWWKLTASVNLTAQLLVPALKLSTPKLDVYSRRFNLAAAEGGLPRVPGANTPRLDPCGRSITRRGSRLRQQTT